MGEKFAWRDVLKTLEANGAKAKVTTNDSGGER
jgi:hypothetical protein